jgi:hypothetical protein
MIAKSIVDRIIQISKNTDLTLDIKPTTVKIELTGRCTLDCTFCNHHTMKEDNIRQEMMSEHNFYIILNNLMSVSSIQEVGLFYMGESALHHRLHLFYRELKNNGYFTYMTTNASIIDNTLKALPYIDSLKVSWNYKNVDDFVKKTRSTSRVYQNIIQNIFILQEECKKLNKVLTISTIMDSSKEEYNEALKKFEEIDHYWLPLQTQCGNNEIGVGGVSGELDHMVKSIPCWSLFKGIYIDVDLNVRMCCYGHQDDHIIGSLMNEKLSTILNDSRLLRIKMQHLSGEIPKECRMCLK